MESSFWYPRKGIQVLAESFAEKIGDSGNILTNAEVTAFKTDGDYVVSLELNEGEETFGDFDVVLLDIKLPGKNGIEIYKHLQKTAKSLARKVVFITGDVMNEDTAAFLSRTKASYISKPFDIEQLKNNIDRVLSGRA